MSEQTKPPFTAFAEHDLLKPRESLPLSATISHEKGVQTPEFGNIASELADIMSRDKDAERVFGKEWPISYEPEGYWEGSELSLRVALTPSDDLSSIHIVGVFDGTKGQSPWFNLYKIGSDGSLFRADYEDGSDKDSNNEVSSWQTVSLEEEPDTQLVTEIKEMLRIVIEKGSFRYNDVYRNLEFKLDFEKTAITNREARFEKVGGKEAYLKLNDILQSVTGTREFISSPAEAIEVLTEQEPQASQLRNYGIDINRNWDLKRRAEKTRNTISFYNKTLEIVDEIAPRLKDADIILDRLEALQRNTSFFRVIPVFEREYVEWRKANRP